MFGGKRINGYEVLVTRRRGLGVRRHGDRAEYREARRGLGISYFFTEFGPNSTTFVYPAELFPVEMRTTGHDIASAAGKVAPLASLVGMAVTLFMLPETKGRGPEELSAVAADAR